MKDVIKISITISVPEGTEVEVSNKETKQVKTTEKQTKTTSKKKKKKDTTNGDSKEAKHVSKDIYKRIKSIERLVEEVKKNNIDYSHLEEEDQEILFDSKDLYAELSYKSENQLKRYQAILLGLINGEGEEEEGDEDEVDF